MDFSQRFKDSLNQLKAVKEAAKEEHKTALTEAKEGLHQLKEGKMKSFLEDAITQTEKGTINVNDFFNGLKDLKNATS